MTKVELSLLLLATFYFLMMTAALAIATEHIVGGSLGWSTPPNKTYFQDWAKERVFCVHDKLVFQYGQATTVVALSDKDDFERCTRNKPIKTYPMGPLTVNLTSPGDYYYYSGVALQCELGLKLHVTVVARDGPKVLPAHRHHRYFWGP